MRQQVIVLIFLPVIVCSQDSPNVCIGQNTCYKGGWISSSSGVGKFATYQGIRYALPPIGDLRFKAPLPYVPEEGNFDVSHISSIKCPQIDFKKQDTKSSYSGQEDCLMLNIYVPESISKGHLKNSSDLANLPVMVWIYGGGFEHGSYEFYQYNPEHLVEKGVIVVTINYRLGALGFLSLGTETVPGNAAFKDQILALSWIQENIANFGGDPGAVTIFGESAGSFSVSALLVSPLATGLFHRAICESGTLLAPSWRTLVPDEVLIFSDRFAQNLGCNSGDLTCLQETSVDQIISLGSEGYDKFNNVWESVMDANFTSTPVFPDDPEFLLATGQFNTDVEVIIGTNSGEGIYYWIFNFLKPSNWDDFRDTFDSDGVKWLFNLLTRDPTAVEIEKAHQIINFYIDSIENVNAQITEQHLQGMVDYETDGEFLYGTRKTLDYLLNHGVTVYQYIFSYVGEQNTGCQFDHCGLGVAHGEELQYIWKSEPKWGKEIDLNEEDSAVRFTVTTAWTDFAKTGDPGLSWMPQTPSAEPKYLNISSPNPVMEYTQDIHDRMQLWDEVLGH